MVEAMASGIPVIALNSEGQTDVCEEARDYLLPVTPDEWQPYNNLVFGACGTRGVPSVEDVAARLRWVAGHRDEARQMGRAASDWVLRHRNIWDKGPKVLDVMEQHLRSARPLRSIPTLWVPSWRTPCGVAEYTAHLAEALPMVRVRREVQDMQGVRLLHVQYAPGLFNTADLTQQVQRAHQMGIPLVITEHAVSPEAQAWERDADVLVALTQTGTNMLQARWPTKRVQHLPLGCPTWFPPRKSSRGKVIGTFGFLAGHKGFWHLLDVLRTLPGTELLMFSHAKSAETEARWTEDARGLPVRRVREFLPVDDIVRHLASEADILVFWYDEFMLASASYAVRIGLATGVPVLASPTSWFYDLHGSAYQPANLLEGVQRLFDDTSLREQLTSRANSYCHDHSWPRIAERHMALWQTLISI
jgi:glycosyltransferase involved in cell wall biosynthesis